MEKTLEELTTIEKICIFMFVMIVFLISLGCILSMIGFDVKSFILDNHLYIKMNL